MQNQLGFGGGPTFITFLSKIIQMNCIIDIVWFWLILCEIFYIYHCALTLIHDKDLLPAVKVCSHSLCLFIRYHDLLLICDHFGIHWSPN